VHTPPTDLPEPALRAALEVGWSLRTATLEYRPVGFGSHHWELTDSTGTRWFVTVDDLRTRRVTFGEPLTGGYHRLRASLAAAQALRAAGRDFVVAPLPTRDGEPLAPLAGSFALAVYPFVVGESFDPPSSGPVRHPG
jgi:Ser/Thr protein kinase RdoA (MazF antagonist)